MPENSPASPLKKEGFAPMRLLQWVSPDATEPHSMPVTECGDAAVRLMIERFPGGRRPGRPSKAVMVGCARLDRMLTYLTAKALRSGEPVTAASVDACIIESLQLMFTPPADSGASFSANSPRESKRVNEVPNQVEVA